MRGQEQDAGRGGDLLILASCNHKLAGNFDVKRSKVHDESKSSVSLHTTTMGRYAAAVLSDFRMNSATVCRLLNNCYSLSDTGPRKRTEGGEPLEQVRCQARSVTRRGRLTMSGLLRRPSFY